MSRFCKSCGRPFAVLPSVLALEIKAKVEERRKTGRRIGAVRAVANELGLNEEYVGRLLLIVERLPPDCIEHWTHAEFQVAVGNMYKASLIKAPSVQREAYYHRAAGGKLTKSGRRI